MNMFRFTIKILAIATLTLAFASLAQAQATRTWVSGVGDDVNPCSRTAPCKTFAGAISKTANNGEIDALDPGGFGAVTITKSITIDGTHGAGFGSILAAGVNAINVNDSLTATPQTIIVRLRGLSLQGAGTGFDGIRFLSGRALFVEDCAIYGFRGNGTNSDGIEIGITAGSGTFTVSVKDTIINNNTGDGIRQNTTVGTLNCSYDNITLANNAKGLEALGGTANVSNSVITLNPTEGLSVNNGAVINAASNTVTANGNGFNAINGTIRLSNNNIHRNNTNAFAGGGTYVTFGNNNVAGNTGSEALPAAIAPK
ncbi:MAG TPA: hypothetical protein VJM12_22070 [Pyrinomonadaceae bacterium]|nr:hypothetical protein [Pyrinomonadaceae bacterium]